jgi:hypothetical protein
MSAQIDAGISGDPGADYIGVDDVIYEAAAPVTPPPTYPNPTI